MIQINEKFKPLISDTNSRYTIITGGRGSGKSFSVSMFLCLLTYERGHVILFTRYTLVSAFISIIPEFLEKIEMLGMQNDFEITKTEIINKKTGSKILFRGIQTSNGDQTANLKSIQGVTTWVIDEAEELTDEIKFDTIDLSIRQQGMRNRVMLILNPTTKEHFIYKRFFENNGIPERYNGTKENVCYIHTDYRDNITNLSDSFIRGVNEMKVKNPAKYEHVILGQWLEKAHGVIFTNWTTGEFNPDNIKTVYGQDYGFSNDPTTLIETAVDKNKKKLYVKEHFVLPGLTTSQITELNLKYANKSLIVGDSSEPRLITELNSKGSNVTAVKKGKDSIITGLTMMLDYEIIVEPNSTHIIKELNNYTWLDKKSNTPIDDHNHCIDAIRYAIYHQLLNPHYGKYSIL